MTAAGFGPWDEAKIVVVRKLINRLDETPG
jgi:hypothetical protein